MAETKRSRLAMLVIFVVGPLIWGESKASCALANADNLKVTEVSRGVTSNDPLRVAPGTRLKGALTYFHGVGLRRTNVVSRSFEGDSSTTVTLSLEQIKPDNRNYIHDVNASPQGEVIAFKYGFSEGEVSGYQLCLLNVKNRKITKVTSKLLSYKDYFWSPDGRYLAYLADADLQGSSRKDTVPKLFVHDTVRSTSQLVVANNFLANSFSWASPGELLYAVPSNDRQDKPQDQGKSQGKLRRPDLFSYSLSSRKSRLLFKDCYRPVVSPDSRRIAFFGSESPSSAPALPSYWQQRADYMTLCVSNLDGTNRVPLNRERGDYPRIVWLEQEQQLVSFKQIAPGPLARMSFTEWNVQTGKREGTVDLTVEDQPNNSTVSGSERLNRPEIFPRFVFLGRYPESNRLLVSSLQTLGRDDDRVVLNVRTLLQVVDLDMDRTEQVAVAERGGKYTSFSWTNK